jgi:3-hydroxyacyl-CoA dehydrogenase
MQQGERPKVCVVGAGTMGSGIAAHLANLGFRVALLDLDQASAAAAFERAKSIRPPHFYVPETADVVQLGSIDMLRRHAEDADWVCEAIVEKLDAKRELLAALVPVLPDRAFVSTNTSGLEIGRLAEGLPDGFRRRFLGTHFFNPPRYLKLLELIPTPETDADVVAAMTRFLEEEVARRVVPALDTPGFIANRFGMWCMFHAIHVAERMGLAIEEVDEITGPFLGRPRSGSFRLNDLVGLDIMADIAQNLRERCPDDPHLAALETPPSLAYLLEKGWIGTKAAHGYYRRENKEIFAFDLMTRGYRMTRPADFPSLAALAGRPLAERLAEGLKLSDDVGEFLRRYLLPALDYAAYLGPQISHNCEDFDRVMMWGFGWEAGPFAMRDMVGLDERPWFSGAMMRDWAGGEAPRRQQPEFRTVHDFQVVAEHEGFRVRDMGDGVRLVSTTTKLGVFSPDLVRSLLAWLDADSGEPFVLTSEGRAFSAGFDLKFLLACGEERDWAGLDAGLRDLQSLGRELSRRRCVSAVAGYCLGGGYEMAASCPVMAVAAESQVGLPEIRVGLIPGGGGTAMLRLRHQSSAKEVVEIAKYLALGQPSSNAVEARKAGLLRPTDVVVHLADRLLHDAKAAARAVAPAPLPEWREIPGPLTGMIDQALADMRKKGEISDHDVLVSEEAKKVLSKSRDYEDALDRERHAFRVLLEEGLTLARIRHMVETGKPLRN